MDVISFASVSLSYRYFRNQDHNNTVQGSIPRVTFCKKPGSTDLGRLSTPHDFSEPAPSAPRQQLAVCYDREITLMMSLFHRPSHRII